jgi:hypothetical protein
MVESRHRSATALSRGRESVAHQLTLDASRPRDHPESVVDFEKAFNDFDAAGGRRVLERHLAELDRVAQALVLEGTEPDARLMALREGLQRLLAALNDLARISESTDPKDAG